MTESADFFAPAGLRTRGTVLVVPGRGETAATYQRFGSRLAFDAYLEAWREPRAPRIGLSRFVFPAKDRKTALDQIGADVLSAAQRFALRGAFPAGIDELEALRRFHSFYGHPDEIIEALQQEQVMPVATDLITQFTPAVPDHDAAIRALELIATEVAPALGWKPSHKESQEESR